MGDVQIRLLGGFRVDLPDGRQAGPWQRPVARRLIQFLAVAPNHRAGREQVTEALFPTLAPARSANALSKALTMARSALAPYDVVLADRDVVWLSDSLEIEIDIDVLQHALDDALHLAAGPERQERLRAVAADHGELLDDEMYSDWTVRARDRLAALRIRAATALAIEADTADAWAAVLTLDPTDEEACLSLMRAYLAAGRRDRAVRTFHRTRAALANDLGIDPSPGLAAEGEALLAGPGSLRREPPTPQPEPQPIFGRDAQVQQLVAAAKARTPTLLSGSAGIGKSLALDHVAHRLIEEGWMVCRGVAVPDDRRAPYAALRAAIRGLETLDSPVLALVMDDTDRPAATRLDANRARLADEVAEALGKQAAARPVLLILDDVQWMDEALHDVLGRLTVRPPDHRWSLLLAGRDDEPGAPLPDFPARVNRLALAPLAEPALHELLRAQGVADSQQSEILRRSQGNPFFATELARHGQSDQPIGTTAVPQRIATLIGNRLGQCSSAARQLAAILALAGNDATYELVVLLTSDSTPDGSQSAAINALDELVAAHLAIETDTGLRLAHPLTAEASLARLNRIRRGSLHGRLATALEATGALQASARHRLAAFESGRLVEFAGPAVRAGFLAGRHARSLFAEKVALDLLQGATSAFDSIPGPDRAAFRADAVAAWAEIGDILLDEGESVAADAAYHAGLALTATDAERERVWSAIGGLHYRAGDLVAAVAAYRRGLAAVSDRSVAGSRLESDLGWSLWRLGDAEAALNHLENATAVLEGSDPFEGAKAFDRLAVALAGSNRQSEAEAAWQRGLELASVEGDPRLLALLHFHSACMLVGDGRYREGLIEVELAQRFRSASSDLYLTGLIHSARADCLTGLGRLDEALDARVLECETFGELGNLRQLAVALAARSTLAGLMNRPDEAAALADAALDTAKRCPDPDRVAAVEQLLASAVPRRPP